MGLPDVLLSASCIIKCLQCTTLLMLWIILTQAAGVSVVICIYLVVVLRFLGSLGCQGYVEIVMKSRQECACVLTHSSKHAPHKLVALTTWFNDEILPYNYLWKTDTSIGESSKQLSHRLLQYILLLWLDETQFCHFKRGRLDCIALKRSTFMQFWWPWMLITQHHVWN